MARRVVSISLPEDYVNNLDEVATRSGVARSRLVREALDRELALRSWRDLQGPSMRAAVQRGIGPEDVERLVDEARAERKAAAQSSS